MALNALEVTRAEPRLSTQPTFRFAHTLVLGGGLWKTERQTSLPNCKRQEVQGSCAPCSVCMGPTRIGQASRALT
jgi:hypothetical protein